jgi:hypothetical protein
MIKATNGTSSLLKQHYVSTGGHMIGIQGISFSATLIFYDIAKNFALPMFFFQVPMWHP